MFEQMGATVSYDPGSQTATVSKAGAEVKVTVGKPEVIINGESRPLDVPPILYHGDVLVPVRVISEGMGGYVQWVPDRRLVVVRYIPATPPPPEAPPPPPEAAPPPPPPPATPNPFKIGGFFRSYYFTRQNASNNPGHAVQLFTPAPNTTPTASIRQVGIAESRSTASTTFRPDGTSARPTCTPIRSTGRASLSRTTPKARSALRKRRPTPIPTIPFPGLPLSSSIKPTRAIKRTVSTVSSAIFSLLAVGEPVGFAHQASRFPRGVFELYRAVVLDGRRRRHADVREPNQLHVQPANVADELPGRQSRHGLEHLREQRRPRHQDQRIRDGKARL